MRLCLTNNPLCTGLNPCEGCHAVRAQILAKSLFAAGYRDHHQLQAMFAHFSQLQDQARAELAHEASLQGQLFEEVPTELPTEENPMEAPPPEGPGEEEVGEDIVQREIGKENLASIMAEAEANRTGEPLTPKPKRATKPKTENIEQEKNHGQE